MKTLQAKLITLSDGRTVGISEDNKNIKAPCWITDGNKIWHLAVDLDAYINLYKVRKPHTHACISLFQPSGPISPIPFPLRLPRQSDS